MRYFNHIFFVLAMTVGLPMVTACNEDDSVDYTEYYDWRDENNNMTTAFYEVQKQDSAQTYFDQRLYSLQEPEWPSFYHYFRHANLDSLSQLSPRKDYRPYYTSTVLVHYTLYKTQSVIDKVNKLGGWTKDVLRNEGGCIDSIFFANAFDTQLKADTIESSQVTFFKGSPTGVITGWGDILQQLYIGDNVVCMIPWYLAYGQVGSSNIDPYSNLFFRIELCDIPNWGDHVK